MKQFSDLFDETQVYEVQRPHRAHLLLTLHLPLRSQKPLAATSLVQQVKCAKKTSIQMWHAISPQIMLCKLYDDVY